MTLKDYVDLHTVTITLYNYGINRKDIALILLKRTNIPEYVIQRHVDEALDMIKEGEAEGYNIKHLNMGLFLTERLKLLRV